MEKVKGLNSIRAICALWVVMNHLGGPPLTEGIDESNIIAKIFSGIFNNLWNGPAAVIVFFVISGFCIHYPNVKTLRIPSLGSYFLRRYLRVGVPLLIVIYISKIFKVEIYSLNDSILWSLFAELIYYTLYPALLIFRRRFLSWVPLISFVFLIAFLIAFTKPTAGNYASFGVELNWLLGLPCWLGGCLLAELIASKNTSSFTSKKFIILLRSFVFGMAVFFSILRWHSPVGYPWTLNIFGMLVIFWLMNETIWFKNNTPNKLLEWFGVWSYSIYLFHITSAHIYKSIHTPNFGFFFNWFGMICFVLTSSYLFYLIIERPSHILARFLSDKISPNKQLRNGEESGINY